jgi:hypothetical protein
LKVDGRTLIAKHSPLPTALAIFGEVRWVTDLLRKLDRHKRRREISERVVKKAKNSQSFILFKLKELA